MFVLLPWLQVSLVPLQARVALCQTYSETIIVSGEGRGFATHVLGTPWSRFGIHSLVILSCHSSVRTLYIGNAEWRRAIGIAGPCLPGWKANSPTGKSASSASISLLSCPTFTWALSTCPTMSTCRCLSQS
ncbi:hypothetical protein V8C86DRAFT_1263155 [Haematococcus lacustris]